MHIKNTILIICFLAILSSCQKPPLEIALERAGDNASELQEVLDHYSKQEADSLKYEAAVFLIENMTYHFGIEQTVYRHGEEVDDFSWGIDNMKKKVTSKKVKDNRNQIINNAIDSLEYFIQKGDALWDIENISSEQLIENIDYAFKAWEMPWCKHLTFDDFCEYILPYRCQTEPLTQWRKYFFDKYYWIKDSLPHDCDVKSACIYLKKELKKQLIYSNSHKAFYQGHLPPHLFEKVQIGACENLSSYTSLVMRSVGIPVLYDQILIYRNADVGHVFNWLVTNDSTGGYWFGVVDANKLTRKLKIIGKVFRRTYQMQENQLFQRFLHGEFVPSGLFNVYQKDVTQLYCKTQPLRYKLRVDKPQEQEYYLCQITKSKGLKPLSYSTVNNRNELTFNNTTTDFIYSLGTYNNGMIEPVGNPFYFTEDSIIDIICDINSVADYKFDREFRKVKMYSVEEHSNIYQVEYWDNDNWVLIPSKWKLQGISSQVNNKGKRLLYTIELKKVPKGALLRFKSKNIMHYTPFTFNKDGKYKSLFVDENDLQSL